MPYESMKDIQDMDQDTAETGDCMKGRVWKNDESLQRHHSLRNRQTEMVPPVQTYCRCYIFQEHTGLAWSRLKNMDNELYFLVFTEWDSFWWQALSIANLCIGGSLTEVSEVSIKTSTRKLFLDSGSGVKTTTNWPNTNSSEENPRWATAALPRAQATGECCR